MNLIPGNQMKHNISLDLNTDGNIWYNSSNKNIQTIEVEPFSDISIWKYELFYFKLSAAPHVPRPPAEVSLPQVLLCR